MAIIPGYSLRVANDGNLQFVLDGDVLEASSTFVQGVWTHVAATYDGTTMRLYINGVDVADKGHSGPVGYDTTGATIGAQQSDGTSVWQGELDEVRVWNVVRSAGDIAANMDLALGPQTGLIGLWHLTEASGLTLADSSGNNLTATLSPIPGNSTRLITFNLTAGQAYLLYDSASTQGITARLYNPNGVMVFGKELTTNPSFTAEVTGTYTLVLEGDITNGAAANYNFQFIPSTTATATLAVGGTASGNISLPSQSIAYSIAVGAIRS